MKMELRVGVRAGVLFYLGFFFSSCGFVQNPGGRNYDSNEASTREELSESELAFSESLFLVIRDRCGDCHNDVSGQAPYFAFPDDVRKSHDNVLALNLVDLSHPGFSRLVIKVKDEGHQTWTGDWEADAAELESAIASWATALGIEEEEILTGSNRVTIPSAIQSCSNSNLMTWTPMSFSLNGIVSGLAGAEFQLRVCQQSDQTYRISDYRVLSPVAIAFSGVKVYVNEIFDATPALNLFPSPLSSFELSNLNSPVLLFPNTPNTADSLSLQNGPGQDKIHLDFESIEVVSN